MTNNDQNGLGYIDTEGRLGLFMDNIEPYAHVFTYASACGESLRHFFKPTIINTMHIMNIIHCIQNAKTHEVCVWRTLTKKNLSHAPFTKYTSFTPVIETPANKIYVEHRPDIRLSDNQVKFYADVNFADRLIRNILANIIIPVFLARNMLSSTVFAFDGFMLPCRDSLYLSDIIKLPNFLTYASRRDLLIYSRRGSSLLTFSLMCLYIKPINNIVEFVMDNTIRKLYSKYIVDINDIDHHLQ